MSTEDDEQEELLMGNNDGEAQKRCETHPQFGLILRDFCIFARFGVPYVRNCNCKD